MIGLAGVLLALGLLIFLAYRGISVLLLAPAMALLAAIFAGAPLLGLYTQVFMTSAGGFVISFFPLFLLGAIFGRLMDDSGAARAIAQGLVARLGGGQAILAVVLACAILTYGGVSLFVVAFAIYPIAASLFREADIPKRLIPATIALGAFTFTMTALPGTPAIQNAIPMPFFGTTPFAAPGLGILAALVMFGAGQWWLMRRAASARARGEGYGDHADHAPASSPDMRERAAGEGFDLAEIEPMPAPAQPPFLLAVLPVVVVILANLIFSSFVIPAWDTAFLAEPRFGGVGLSSVLGVWSIILALSAAILVLVATNWGRLASVKTSLDAGANASVLPIFNTASLVGFGAVIAALPAFDLVRQGVLGIGGENPLVSLAIAVNVLAGITGSASGGMSIALSTLGDTYVQMGAAAGIAPEALHRITAIATGGLDSLPHNGAVVTLLAICGLTHRQSYGDLAMVAVVFPLLALVVAILAASFLGAF
ncbi:GntP family permease [Roseococcus suduntuyensis]|uniref:H+/gluconate symporter-like permease n=1 Tax=Roseococcus suduntuyensis TaxID=455361 RepID=A0A840A427_9PROT|nr:GntP family permease [Roseococcus suduntuyensis]MBB3896678.1 H+/gluconate symporter-like permease [Roseococcus suduntuyensis]